MGTPTTSSGAPARRARRGFRRAEQQVRKLPGVPPMKPEDISAQALGRVREPPAKTRSGRNIR